MQPTESKQTVEARLTAVRAQHGPWTAHNISLPFGAFTIGPDASTSDIRRGDYFAGIVMSVLGRDLSGLKVLDLGCLEGGLSIQFARMGAIVDGLDIRGDSIAKARVAAEILGLPNVRFIEGNALDLRANLTLQSSYDVVVCAGLLYHLDAQDHIPFMESIAQMCAGITIVDSHFSADGPDSYVTRDGVMLRGRFIEERGKSSEERKSAMWASWGNNRSFWPTETSLLIALQSAGFAFVAAARQPKFEWPWQDRSTWLAFKGTKAASMLVAQPDRNSKEMALTHPSVAVGRNIGVRF